MALKLMIKVVAFFLGHPVYMFTFESALYTINIFLTIFIVLKVTTYPFLL